MLDLGSFSSAQDALRSVCQQLPLHGGGQVLSRNGNTTEMQMVSLEITDPRQRYITLKERKASVYAQIAETVWVLSGRNDIEWLSTYLPRAADFSDDGRTWRAGYGPRLRSWGTDGVDQLKNVVEVLRDDPTTRRAVISLYDPSSDPAGGKDVPCNNWLHFLMRDSKLHLHVAVRSNDLIWGWSGINQFEWSVLLESVASMLGVSEGSVHYSISSLHVYARHLKRVEKIAGDTPLIDSPLGRKALFSSVEDLDEQLRLWYQLEDRLRCEQPMDRDMYLQLCPMLREWIDAIGYYWLGDKYLLSWVSKAIRTSLELTERPSGEPKAFTDTFADYASSLHAKKSAVYGDSWKRRGETLGILANIARKVDRLGLPGAGDSNLDTSVDLLIYLAKYRWWMADNGAPPPDCGRVSEDEDDRVDKLLRYLENHPWELSDEVLLLKQYFERVAGGESECRWPLVDNMLRVANTLARREWWADGNRMRFWQGYGD